MVSPKGFFKIPDTIGYWVNRNGKIWSGYKQGLMKLQVKKDGYSSWKSKPATKKELKEARADLTKGLKSKKYEFMAIGRSCWVCNGAHDHLIDMPAMNCFACSRIYHKGIDVMDYNKNRRELKFQKLHELSNNADAKAFRFKINIK